MFLITSFYAVRAPVYSSK